MITSNPSSRNFANGYALRYHLSDNPWQSRKKSDFTPFVSIFGRWAKDCIREITRRNRSEPFRVRITKLNEFLSGWVVYFRLAECRKQLEDIDGWIRRKMRCVRLKQCKRTGTVAKFLMDGGVPEWRSWLMALSGKGWWRKAGSPQSNVAMTKKWFNEQVCPVV